MRLAPWLLEVCADRWCRPVLQLDPVAADASAWRRVDGRRAWPIAAGAAGTLLLASDGDVSLTPGAWRPAAAWAEEVRTRAAAAWQARLEAARPPAPAAEAPAATVTRAVALPPRRRSSPRCQIADRCGRPADCGHVIE